MKLQNNLTYYRDVELEFTPRQWSTFIVPTGISVVWDDYNFKKGTVVGRFYVSEAHLYPDMRKTKEDLDSFLATLGRYIVTENSINKAYSKLKSWGQRTVSYEGNPLLEQLKHDRKDLDIHRVDTSGKINLEEGRHYDAKRIIGKEELLDINHSIIWEAEHDPTLKQFKDKRQKYERRTNDGYEVYTAVLEEVI